MDEILSIAKESSLFVVEDCAQAHGARYRDRKVGTMGVFGCFSFFPGKNLGAYGDAGALITNDDQLALKAKMYANHGRIGKYDHEFEGTNSRLDGLQAAILDVKLKHLDTWTARRRAIAELYDQGLKAPVITPRTDARNYSVYHLYVVRVPNREQVQKLLAEKGITTGIHYPIPLPFLKAYSHFKATPADFPVCHTQKDAILSLPVFDSMTNEQAGYIIDTLNGIAAKL
jgi:dTDP-4-amino-4,6-dideoxygalactose transaminase